MANAREIQSRMKSIRDTMKITNAMYMISSTKLRHARREWEETEPFFYMLQNTVSRILRHVPDMELRYFKNVDEESVRRRGFLVVTADKGMAGAYNHNVLKRTVEEIEKMDFYSLLVVGEVGRQYFHSRKIPVDEHFLYTAQNPTMNRARVIGAKVMELFDTGQVEEIYMIYTEMKNAMQTETRMQRLLPLEKAEFQTAQIPAGVMQEEFDFEPSPESVMESIIPNYVEGYIFGALISSYCSEHNARMMAMQSANDSAQEMIHDLSIEYNRVRQAAITQEITEVVSGARAQKRKRES